MKYVEIDDDADEEGPGESDGDKELPPAVKIGPPKHKGKKIPTSTHNSGQVPEDSMLFAPIPGPSTLTRSKQSPKKKISKRKQPDVIARPTDKPVTRSSSRPGLTKKIVVSDEASYIARTDQGHKRSRRDGDKQLVDTVSKFFEAWQPMETDLPQIDHVRKRKRMDEPEPTAGGSKKKKSTSTT